MPSHTTDPDRPAVIASERAPDTHDADTYRQVQVATLQAENELLQHRIAELEGQVAELEADVDDLEAEVDRRQSQLAQVITRYERLLSERGGSRQAGVPIDAEREVSETDKPDDAESNDRSTSLSISLPDSLPTDTVTRMRHFVRSNV
jgi:chromosome segregation ATPase